MRPIIDSRRFPPAHLLSLLERPFDGTNPDGWYDGWQDERATTQDFILDEFGNER